MSFRPLKRPVSRLNATNYLYLVRSDDNNHNFNENSNIHYTYYVKGIPQFDRGINYIL